MTDPLSPDDGGARDWTFETSTPFTDETLDNDWEWAFLDDGEECCDDRCNFCNGEFSE